jgi:hypothetical protein
MTDFMKTDIFFFATTVCIVFVSIFLIIFLVRISKFLKKARDLGEEIKDKAEDMGEEAEEFLERINGSFIMNLLFPKRPKEALEGVENSV